MCALSYIGISGNKKVNITANEITAFQYSIKINLTITSETLNTILAIKQRKHGRKIGIKYHLQKKNSPLISKELVPTYDHARKSCKRSHCD